MDGTSKTVLKHVLVAKFKDDVPTDTIAQVINAYANLISLIPPMKAFHWGTNLNRFNKHRGFTHVFESTFESLEDIDVYMVHPAHLKFAEEFHAVVDKYLVFDYEPSTVNL